MDWLSPINFFRRQADISQERKPGTGGWLLADPVFKKWKSSSGSTLWCYGIRMFLITLIGHRLIWLKSLAGAGKTVLAYVHF
jgi:hypothetical protein